MKTKMTSQQMQSQEIQTRTSSDKLEKEVTHSRLVKRRLSDSIVGGSPRNFLFMISVEDNDAKAERTLEPYTQVRN